MRNLVMGIAVAALCAVGFGGGKSDEKKKDKGKTGDTAKTEDTAKIGNSGKKDGTTHEAEEALKAIAPADAARTRLWLSPRHARADRGGSPN